MNLQVNQLLKNKENNAQFCVRCSVMSYIHIITIIQQMKWINVSPKLIIIIFTVLSFFLLILPLVIMCNLSDCVHAFKGVNLSRLFLVWHELSSCCHQSKVYNYYYYYKPIKKSGTSSLLPQWIPKFCHQIPKKKKSVILKMGLSQPFWRDIENFRRHHH